MPLLKQRKRSRSKSKPKAKPKAPQQKQTQSQTVIIQGGEPVKRRKQSARKPGVGNKTHEAKAPSSTDALLLTLLDTFKKADLSRDPKKFEVIKTEAPRPVVSKKSTGINMSLAEQEKADLFFGSEKKNDMVHEMKQRQQARHEQRTGAMKSPYPSSGSDQSGSGLGNAMADPRQVQSAHSLEQLRRKAISAQLDYAKQRAGAGLPVN